MHTKHKSQSCIFFVLISWYVLWKCRKIMALIFKDTTRNHRRDKGEEKDATVNWCESSFLLLDFISMYIIYYVIYVTYMLHILHCPGILYIVFCILHIISISTSYNSLYFTFCSLAEAQVQWRLLKVLNERKKSTIALWSAISSLKVDICVPHTVPKEDVSEQKANPNIPNRIGVPSFVDIRCFVTKTCLHILRT